MAAKTKRKISKAAKPKARRGGFDALNGTLGGMTATSRFTASWLISGLSTDAEIRQSLYLARQRCRQLEWENDYVREYLNENESNVIGSEGVVLQMKIKEQADRVIFDPEEKAFILAYEREQNEKRATIRKWLTKRHGWTREQTHQFFPRMVLLHPCDENGVAFSRNGQTDGEMMQIRAKVLKGQPDVFANNQIEQAWARWKHKENCTVTRQLEFHESERLQLRTCAVAGEALVRKVKGFDNDFQFAIQLIDPDWLDVNYNAVLPNGNEVRMGVEFNSWREPVAYHIIIRNAGDWMRGVPYSGGNVAYGNRERIDAREIVHPFIRERIDQSRGIPWFISVITTLRILGKYREAELIASMAAACKTEYYYSDVLPEGGVPADALPDPRKEALMQRVEPGTRETLPWGVKIGQLDPKHPNGNHGEFTKAVLRGVAAGLPGATYYGISGDLEAVNFSSMRGGDRQARESWMMLQKWEISQFHQPIFKDWLEAAILTGQVKLSMSKLDYYVQCARWQGRRWSEFDPIKDVTSAILKVKNGFTSRQRIISEWGGDLEEIFYELAYEESLADTLGLVFGDAQDVQNTADANEPDDTQDNGKKPNADDAATEKIVSAIVKRELNKRNNPVKPAAQRK